MKETILYELEYDENGKLDIRVTMKTRLRNITFWLSKAEIPDFEVLPANVQIDILSRLVVTVVKDIDAEKNAIEMSERNSRNRSKFEPKIMELFESIVDGCKNNKPSRYWEVALQECANYAKKNFEDPVYVKISRMGVKDFKKMIEHYKRKNARNSNPPQTSRSS